MQSSDHDLSIKLLIIGDSGVGKTCLLMRYCESVFNSNHLTTIGKMEEYIFQESILNLKLLM